MVCVSAPDQFVAVGYHYRDFSPTSDDEVIVAPRRGRPAAAVGDRSDEAADCDVDVEIPVGAVMLEGHLHLPEPAAGRGRLRPRQREQPPQPAEPVRGRRALRRRSRHPAPRPAHARGGARPRPTCSTSSLLGRPARAAATGWLQVPPGRAGSAGSATSVPAPGPAAALWAAADGPASVGAVVSRGGRPDLARRRLGEVQAPTLLIVGGADEAVLEPQPSGPGAAALPEPTWPSSRAPRTCSRSRGPWPRPRHLARDWFTPVLAGRRPAPRRRGRSVGAGAAAAVRRRRRPGRDPRPWPVRCARVGRPRRAGRAGGPARFVCIGEASHGTHEYYRWRAQLSRRLIEEHGFTWIGVEGDWPDCWRINRWVRGHGDQDLDARGLLARFERWPTWMWANEEVAEFLDWLREWNAVAPAGGAGRLLRPRRVLAVGLAAARSSAGSRPTPPTRCRRRCRPGSASSLRRGPARVRLEHPAGARVLRGRRRGPARRGPTPGPLRTAVDDEDAFDALQNAEVAADAEHYYRIMVRGDRESWNIRDHHMVDTVDRLAHHLGPRSKGLVWEHNTHVGDARATDMARDGLVNVGQLLRERHGRRGRGAGRLRRPPAAR